MNSRALPLLLATALLLSITTACTRHNDADTAVPGANTGNASTAAAPANSSTAGQNR